MLINKDIMHVIDIGPVNNNPQTFFTLVFGDNVSISEILNTLQQVAEFREKLGLTTKNNTIEIIEEAKLKLLNK